MTRTPLTFDGTMIETDEGLLAGIIIQIETISDNFDKAIARYEYPYADGADLEDMGEKEHVIRFRCWFWDDDEQQSYDTHTLLLDALAVKDRLDFTHPKYGLLKGKIESIAIMHNDAVRAVAVDVTFIEQMRSSLSVSPAQSVTSAVAQAYTETQAAQESVIAQAIAAIIPGADARAITKTLDSAQGLLTQMQGFSNTTRAFVAGVETRLASAEAVVDAIVSPANTLQAAMTYSATLPGRILGTLSTTLEKYGLLYQAVKNYPRLYIERVNQAMDTLAASFDTFTDRSTSGVSRQTGSMMSAQLAIVSAQRLALEAADVYAADQEAASGQNDDVTPMTIDEMEATLAVVRTRLMTAIEAARELDGLKEMAAALLTQVNTVRLEREKMVSVVLDNPMPLHLVCLKYGLSCDDAERLIKVNPQIINPNFTDGEVRIYARKG